MAGAPDSCPVCVRQAAQDQEGYPQSIEGGSGIAFRGVNYHLNDFAMIRTDGPVCMIGQIVDIAFEESARAVGACDVSVIPLGRMDDIRHLCTNEAIVKDEVCAFNSI